MASTNTPYTELVRLISDGESVSAGVTNRATQDLAQRTQNLREALQSLSSGQSLLHTNVAIQSGLAVGAPVYLDGATYKPAKAAAGSGSTPAPESMVVGLVQSKLTDTTGAVAFAGRIPVSDWSTVTEDGLSTPGVYYLSAATAGKLSRSRSSVAVYVGVLTADGSFIIQPRQPAYTDHDHTVFSLVGDPAGSVTDPAIGGVHAVTTPSTGSRGWLPANATYFTGWTIGVQIPSNAKFGYNLQHASEAALLLSFPPVPVESAVAVQAGVTVTPSPLVVNAYGIWWVDDTYGNAPWPVDYAVTTTAPAIQLWLTRTTALAGATGVTALTGAGSSVLPIEVVNSGGSPASTGAVQLRIPSLLTVSSSTDESHLAMKSTTGNTQTKGPVVARVKPGANVTITASHGDSTDGYHGLLTITASTGSGYAGTAVPASLNSAVKALVNDFTVVQLPVGVVSGPTWELEISELAAATVTVAPIVWLHGTVSQAVPATVTYQTKVITPTVPGVLATQSWSAAAQMTAISTAVNTASSLTLPTLVVPKGSKVLIKINRAGNVDTYAGALNILRVAYTAT